jgi:hypothetical protein
MKKTINFLIALILMGNFTFAQVGSLYTWIGPPEGLWTDGANWIQGTLPYAYLGVLPSPNLFPGGPNATEDWVRFDNGAFNSVVGIPVITLGMLEANNTLSPALPTYVFLSGDLDGATITLQTATSALKSYLGSIYNNNYWSCKIDDDCVLDLNNAFGYFAPSAFNRVNLVCQPDANFFQRNGALFFPADYSAGGTVCDVVNKGFVLQANASVHAEYVQQHLVYQDVKGWAEYYFDDNHYHYVCPPVTSEFTPEFLSPNCICRKANSLHVFDCDYVRKFDNLLKQWEPWIGTVGCFHPVVNIEKGRPVEVYGNSSYTPGPIYSFYGTFNSAPEGNEILFPVETSLKGYNFIGNPFPSAIRFADPSGAPTAGPGWVWDCQYTDPVTYYYDNNVNAPFYGNHYYNWFTGWGTNGYLSPLDQIIPRSQGFFVNVFAPGPLAKVLIGNQARVFQGNLQIGKSAGTNFLNIKLKDEAGNNIDGTIIGFSEDANGTDYDRLRDAYKWFNEIANVSQLYFKTTDNVNAAMKTLKPATGNVMYPLYMKVTSTGNYSLDVKDISTFSPNTGISLKDNKTNATVDLKVNPVYTFTAVAGDDDARFSLYFTDVLYGIHNLENNSLQVFSSDHSIYIQNNDLENITGTVVVYDLIGRQMIQEKLNGDAITRINTDLNNGFYLVSVKTDRGVYNQKVYLN